MTKLYFLSLCLVLISYLTLQVQAVVYPGEPIDIAIDQPIVYDQPSIAEASNPFYIEFRRKVITDEGEFVSVEIDFSRFSPNETLDISSFLTGDGAFIDASTFTLSSCEFASENKTVLIAPPFTKCLLIFKMSALPSLTKEYLLTRSGKVVSFHMEQSYRRTLEHLYLKKNYQVEQNSRAEITPDSLPNSKFESTYELEFTYNFASEPKTFTSDFTIREMTLLFPFLKIHVESCFYRNRDDPEPISFTRNKQTDKWGITLQNVSYLPTEDIQNTIVCVLSADQNISTINMYNMNAKLNEDIPLIDNNRLILHYQYMLTSFIGAPLIPNAMVSHFKGNELSITTTRMPIGDVNFSMTFMKALFGVNDFEVSGDCKWDNEKNTNSNILMFKIPVTASEDTNRCTFKLKNDKKFPSFFSMGYTKNHSPLTTFFVHDDSSYRKDAKFNIDKEKEEHYLRGYNLNPYYRYCLDVNDVTFDFDLSKYRITYNERDAEGCRKGSPILTFFTSEVVEKLDLKMATFYSQNKFFGSAVTILPLRYDIQRIEELANGETKVLVVGPKLLPIGDDEDITIGDDNLVSFNISNPLSEPFYLNHYESDKSKFKRCTFKSESSKNVEIKSFKSSLNGKPIVSLGPITKENINGEMTFQCYVDLNIRYIPSYNINVFLLTEESMNRKSRNFNDVAQYANTKFIVPHRYFANYGPKETLHIQWNLTEEALKSQITKAIDIVDTIVFKNNNVTRNKAHVYYLNITETQSNSNHGNYANQITFSNVENMMGTSSKKVNIELVFSNLVHFEGVYQILEEARNNTTFDLKPYTFTLTETTFPLFTYCEDREYVCGSLCVACLDEARCVSDFDCFSQECRDGNCLSYEDSSTDKDDNNSSTNHQSSIYLIFVLFSVAILQMIL